MSVSVFKRVSHAYLSHINQSYMEKLSYNRFIKALQTSPKSETSRKFRIFKICMSFKAIYPTISQSHPHYKHACTICL